MMIESSWKFAIGLGLIGLGPCIFEANTPSGDMIWEWPSFGAIVLIIGVILVARSIADKPGGARKNED